jgi:hypothetical protein
MERFCEELRIISYGHRFGWTYIGEFAKDFLKQVNSGCSVEMLREYLEKRYSITIDVIKDVGFSDIEDLYNDYRYESVSILFSRLLTLIESENRYYGESEENEDNED